MNLNYSIVEIPSPSNQYKEILDEFIKSGEPIVEVMDFPKGTKVMSVYTYFYDVIRKKGYPVKVSTRKGRIFLISKKDGDLQNEPKL